MKIHRTAIVEDGARLGADIEVGAYAIIGPKVVLGDRCKIRPHAVLSGQVEIGRETMVGTGTLIGEDPQVLGFDPSTESGVRIGTQNVIREYVTIHRATQPGGYTSVGERNLIMTGVHFGHDVTVGNGTIMANNVLLAGHVKVADGAVLGGGTVFHQHMRVGRLCMVRGGTRFGKDIPPFLVADRTNVVTGLNAIGLRRAGLSSESRMELKRLFKLLFRSGLNVSQALDEAARESWGAEAAEMMAFVREAKQRGICRASLMAGSEADE